MITTAGSYKAVVMGGVLAVTIFIAGCPVPIPSGYSTSSRQNLNDESTGRLVAGVTTREDVLLMLGEPDNDGPNDSWLVYGSVYGKGGVLFVMCAGNDCGGVGSEKMEYRRLIITFNELGVMTNAEFVSRECWEGTVGMGRSGDRSVPCLQVYDPPDIIEESDANQESLYQSGQKVIPQDLLDFARGKAELTKPGWTTGLAEAGAAVDHTRLTKELHEKRQWESLARIVLNDNYGDNLRWYYLGRAAEGMGLCDAALHYYGISEERSETFVTRCLGGVCAGINLPEALEARMIAIEANRTSGKCVNSFNK